MKILKIFGIVVGIHVFALILIFANPGCSSTTRPAPQPADTITQPTPTPTITLPTATNNVAPTPVADPMAPAVTPPPTGFNPDAPATYADSGSSGVHFTPTRPNSPAASALTTPPVSDVTPAAGYKVKSGDSLWTIAKHNHLTVAELATANNLKPTSVLHQGQSLIIPGKSGTTSTSSSRSTTASSAGSAAMAKPAADTPAPARGSGEELHHTVKSGETLGQIAHKYGVKMRDLEVRNNIVDPMKVRAGTELIIPGWKSPGKGSKSSSTASSVESAPTSAPTASTPPMIVPESSNSAASSSDDSTSPPANNVPVIHIDENPLTPAPKS